MTQQIKVTGNLLKLLAEALERHPNPFCGADLINQRGMLSGSLYPLLERLTKAGWLTRTVEDIDPVVEGRPRKRLYTLTSVGAKEARQIYREYKIDNSVQLRPAPT